MEGGKAMNQQSALPSAYRLDEGERRTAVAKSLPRCVFIEVTNRCNLLCTTCPRTFHDYEEPKDLSLDEFVAIAEQFPQMERAVLHGIGEPLLNGQLPEMIRYLKGRDVHVLFNSNGTLLTPSWQEALIQSGLDEYRVSLDAAHPELYERIRGRPFLSRVLAHLREFVSTKANLGSDLPRTSLWCMGMRDNVDELVDLVRVAAEIGIPEVYLQRLTYDVDPAERRGLGQIDQALFGQLYEHESEVIAECQRQSRDLGIAFQASGATDPRRSLGAARSPSQRPWMDCRRPWTTAYITANGNALPCCIAPFATTRYGDLILGNVWEQGFDELWNGEPYRSWREALLSDSPRQACTGCGVHWSL